MKSRDIDQKIQKLLDGQLPPEKMRELRKFLRNQSPNIDDFELYRSLERKLAELGEDTNSKEWETRHDAIRSAMERDALLGQTRRPIGRRVFKIVAGLAILATITVSLPRGLKWLAEKAPVPASTVIEVRWLGNSEQISDSELEVKVTKPVKLSSNSIDVNYSQPEASARPVGKPMATGVIVIIHPEKMQATPSEMISEF